jgi:hypothetical protein
MHRRKGLTAAIVGVISIALVVGAVGAALAANSTVSAKLSGKAEEPGRNRRRLRAARPL